MGLVHAMRSNGPLPQVWNERVYPKIPSIDSERHKYMTDHGMKSCNTSFKLSNSFNHHFKHFLANTWNLWVNSFVLYFIHIIVSFTNLCLKALHVILGGVGHCCAWHV